MAFSSYKSIGAVVKEFQTKYTEADFIGEIEFNIPDYFREDLQLPCLPVLPCPPISSPNLSLLDV
jgi:hypothetical protein